jgi:hypothetical protein
MSKNNPTTGSGDKATQVHTLQLSQQEVAQMANIGGGSISFGPVTLSWNFTLSPLAIDLKATLLGATIGEVHLSPDNPSASIGGSIAGFTAKIDLSLDLANKVINYHIVVSTPFGVIIDKSGSIHL